MRGLLFNEVKMKPGKITIYVNEQLANHLNGWGLEDSTGRGIADVLNYITPALDGIMRDEKGWWRKRLTSEEWFVCQSCTVSRAFAMDSGGAWSMDIGAVLACVEDTLDSKLCMDDAVKWRKSTIDKLLGTSVSHDLALVWMLIRERKRQSK
jgi:hypothetical protein